jgi:hypothetical protein
MQNDVGVLLLGYSRRNYRPARAGGGEGPVIVPNIACDAAAYSRKAGDAGHSAGRLLGSHETWQEDGQEQAENRNDHKQFDERKRPMFARGLAWR